MPSRRTMLFVPGNNPGMLQSAPVLGADSVIFDLEDAVAMSEKDAARDLVCSALRAVQFEGTEIVVRINALDSPYWKQDVADVIAAGVDCILVPKCSTAHDVHDVAAVIAQEEKRNALAAGSIVIMPLLEGALGVENAFSIANADKRVSSLFFGAEDFCADMGAQRTATGEEIQFARGRIVLAAKAAHIGAIDTPFTNVDDYAGVQRDSELGRQMGFDGKAVISPQHVRIVNRVFTPTEKEIAWAERVKAAMEKGAAEGKGAVSLDGNMIDGPIVKRALDTLRKAGLLEEHHAE